MNIKSAAVFLVTALAGGVCLAQNNPPVIVEDFKPSVLNQPGQEYPQVNSQRYARFRIKAPNADSARVSLGLGVEEEHSCLKQTVVILLVRPPVQWMKASTIIVLR